MSKYHHLFFDLDHTLWDYEKNSAATLELLYDQYDLEAQARFNLREFNTLFTEVNEHLWDQYHEGKIDQQTIRSERFKIILDKLNHPSDIAAELSDIYISQCPKMGHVIPGALEILEYLGSSYEMHIITNGFSDIQDIKLSTTGLEKYFDQIIISSTTQYRKPDREIFDLALEKAGASSESSLMIGDSLISDIRGAKNASIDQVYYNPNQIPHDEEITYEIRHLSELKRIGL